MPTVSWYLKHHSRSRCASSIGGLVVNTNGSYIPDIDSEFQILTADITVINQFNVALMPDLGDERARPRGGRPCR